MRRPLDVVGEDATWARSISVSGCRTVRPQLRNARVTRMHGNVVPLAHGGLEEDTAPLWRALADPTRRRILDLLRQRPLITGEIAAQFPISRIAVMRHLEVLGEAGLVTSRKRGRERWHYLNTIPLASADVRDAWYTKPLLELGRQECAWRRAVSLGDAIVAGQKAASTRLSASGRRPLSKPTALGAYTTGTQRDSTPPIRGRYVLVRHPLAAVNSRSAH